MVLPGEAGEAIVTVDQSEPQGLVKSDGKLEVANEDLDDQLLGGIDVARAGRGIRRSTLSRQGIRPSSHEIDAVPPAAGSPRFCVPRPPASRYATAATDWKCCFSPAIPAPPCRLAPTPFPGDGAGRGWLGWARWSGGHLPGRRTARGIRGDRGPLRPVSRRAPRSRPPSWEPPGSRRFEREAGRTPPPSARSCSTRGVGSRPTA